MFLKLTPTYELRRNPQDVATNTKVSCAKGKNPEYFAYGLTGVWMQYFVVPMFEADVPSGIIRLVPRTVNHERENSATTNLLLS